jgi:hypothetical protein
MYLTDCRINQLSTSLLNIENRVDYINHKVSGDMFDGLGYNEYNDMTEEKLNEELSRLLNEKENIELSIFEEKRRREECRLENNRRQHNYIPLIFEMLKYLSEKDVLERCYQKAKEDEEKEEAKKKNK